MKPIIQILLLATTALAQPVTFHNLSSWTNLPPEAIPSAVSNVLLLERSYNRTNITTQDIGDTGFIGITNIPISAIRRGTNAVVRSGNPVWITNGVITLNYTNASITNAYSAEYLKKWAESGELCAIRGHAWGEKQPCFAATIPACDGHRYCLLCKIQQ